VISDTTALYSRTSDDRLDLGERLRVRTVLGLVSLHGRVAEQREQFVVFRFDGEELVEHLRSLSEARSQKSEVRSKKGNVQANGVFSSASDERRFALLASVFFLALSILRDRRQKRHFVALATGVENFAYPRSRQRTSAR